MNFHRLLISRTARDTSFGDAVYNKFARLIPIQEYEDDSSVFESADVLRKGSLVVVCRPEDGWVSEANHGLLYSRSKEYYIHPIIGCRSGCTYCYLQASQLGRLPLRLHVDFDDLMRAIRECLGIHGEGLLFSSGELADSLADQDLYPVPRMLVEKFANLEGGTLELRTKSDEVGNLLDANHKGNTTISFSLMPDIYSRQYEPGTASVRRRLIAAKKLKSCGYSVAVNLEPLVIGEGWQSFYESLISDIKDEIGNVKHISVGCLRWSERLGGVGAFFRDYSSVMARGDRIEYKPGKFNGTLKLEERLYSYRWIKECLARHGFGGVEIIWSMEEASVIEALVYE